MTGMTRERGRGAANDAWLADPDAQEEFRAWLATLPAYCPFCGGPLAHCHCGPFTIEVEEEP